jgi:hypothetical protein
VPIHLRVLAETVWRLEAEAGEARGPRLIQLQAERLAVLGLNGSAYALLRPHRDAVIEAGESAAASYALLAFRAGADDEARRVLAHHGAPRSRVEEMLMRWGKETGRVDAPLGGAADADYERTVTRLLTEWREQQGVGVRTKTLTAP